MSDEENLVKIPCNYDDLLNFIHENRELILSNYDLIPQVLDALDKLLIETESLSDLHRDSKLILEIATIQQEMLSRVLKKGLTIETILMLSERNSLEPFYNQIKASNLKVEFANSIVLESVTENTTKKINKRTTWDVNQNEAIIPSTIKAIDNETQNDKAINKIKSLLAEKSKISFLRLVIDPNSYAKTIINAFYVSLAVRLKIASIIADNGELFVCRNVFKSEEAYGHSVFSLTPEEYKNLKDKLKISSSLL